MTAQLRATTEVAHAGVAVAMERMRRDHEKYSVEAGGPLRWAFRLPYGELAARMRGPVLEATVTAPDDTSLCYMRMRLVDHLAEYLGEAPQVGWRGHGARLTTPPFLREVEVVESFDLTPAMRRVVFAGCDLARFAGLGLHVRLLFPPSGRAPVRPVLNAGGSLVWPAGEDMLTARVYTIREIDVAAGRLAIDFAQHPCDGASAAAWSRRARAGTRIGLLGPGGGDAPKAPDLLFAGDDTALPAIARSLAELKPGTRAEVFLEVEGPASEQPLPSPAEINLHWLHRGACPPGTAGLLPAALRAVDATALPPGLFVWAGCEFADFREIRRLVRRDWAIPRERHLVVSYWRRGRAGESGEDQEQGG